MAVAKQGGGHNFAAALVASAALHGLLLWLWAAPDIKLAPARPKALEARLAPLRQDGMAQSADAGRAAQGEPEPWDSEAAGPKLEKAAGSGKANAESFAARAKPRPAAPRQIPAVSRKQMDIPVQKKLESETGASAAPAAAAAKDSQPQAQESSVMHEPGAAGSGQAGRGPSGRRGQEGQDEAARAVPMGYGQREAVPYPAEALRRRLEGTARIWVRVDASGRVLESKVAASSGFESLDKAALEAVSRWKFKPGTKNGEPAASSEAFVPVVFRVPEF